jgi:hypothetical protein
MKPSIDMQQLSSVYGRSAIGRSDQVAIESRGRLGRGASAHYSGHDDDCARQGCYQHKHAERSRRRDAVVSPGLALAKPMLQRPRAAPSHRCW